MRLKEDAMRNGQLKPAYNLQHAVDAQYITWLDVSPRPTDVTTLVPFLKDMGFRQYLYRGKENVLAAIAHSINKLHFKIQSGRTGQFLTDLKTALILSFINSLSPRHPHR